MTRVEKKVKSKGGFTILEVVIAMAIIAIVTATAASIMTSAQKSMARSQKSVLAANDIANITECFKYTVCKGCSVDDFEDFEKAVEFAFGLAPEGFTPTTDGVYDVYDVYELTRDGYVITVTVTTGTEKTVNSVAKDGDGKVIFELTYPQT